MLLEPAVSPTRLERLDEILLPCKDFQLFGTLSSGQPPVPGTECRSLSSCQRGSGPTPLATARAPLAAACRPWWPPGAVWCWHPCSGATSSRSWTVGREAPVQSPVEASTPSCRASRSASWSPPRCSKKPPTSSASPPRGPRTYCAGAHGCAGRAWCSAPSLRRRVARCCCARRCRCRSRTSFSTSFINI